MTHTNRIAGRYGKEGRWVATPRPGPHVRGESIPLVLVLRDYLKICDNAKEAKRIIRDGIVCVDKKVRKDHKYAVGLMDVVSIMPIKKHYRMLPKKKGLKFVEISEKEAGLKLVKIVGKTKVKQGVIQLNLHDGGSIVVEKDTYNVSDTLKLSLPNRKISDTIKFAKGATAMVVSGRHSGEVDKIAEVLPGMKTRKSLTEVGDLRTLTEYIFVIGKGKPEITL